MIAMDVAAFQPPAEFAARMEQLVAAIKAVPAAAGFDEVFYPGEIEARNDVRQRRDGLVLPQDTLADLAKVARETGLVSKLPF
jgi:LDH2 family malate/lactate/ureidoglycolate dehydrogenase